MGVSATQLMGGDNERDEIVLLRTVQAPVLKCLFETSKEIVTDITFTFTKDTICIAGIDGTKSAMVDIVMRAESFESYEFNAQTPDVICSVCVAHLFRLLKNCTHHDVLTVSMFASRMDVLVVVVENYTKQSRIEAEVKLLDMEGIALPPRMPPPSMDRANFVLSISAQELQRVCKDLMYVSDTLCVASTRGGSGVCFRADGDIGKLAYEFQVMYRTAPAVASTSSGGMSDYNTNGNVSTSSGGGGKQILCLKSTQDTQPYTPQWFPTKFMLMFTKTTPLGNALTIYLSNDFPVVLQYEIDGFATVSFCLAPIDAMNY